MHTRIHCDSCTCIPRVRPDGHCEGLLVSDGWVSVVCRECGLRRPWDDPEALERRGKHRPAAGEGVT
jgi:hypothetical protein